MTQFVHNISNMLTDFGGETKRKGTLENPKLITEDNIN
jgi:hypothetical protein